MRTNKAKGVTLKYFMKHVTASNAIAKIINIYINQ